MVSLLKTLPAWVGRRETLELTFQGFQGCPFEPTKLTLQLFTRPCQVNEIKWRVLSKTEIVKCSKNLSKTKYFETSNLIQKFDRIQTSYIYHVPPKFPFCKRSDLSANNQSIVREMYDLCRRSEVQLEAFLILLTPLMTPRFLDLFHLISFGTVAGSIVSSKIMFFYEACQEEWGGNGCYGNFISFLSNLSQAVDVA